MIKIAVCDDEPFMRAEMASRISGYMEENKIPCQLHCFGGGGEILGSDMAFDILFLDIQMEGMDGMEAARLMRARGYGGMLIFITVLKEEVFEAFEVRAFDYLVKPLEDSRFKRTMGRTLAALVQELSLIHIYEEMMEFAGRKACPSVEELEAGGPDGG